MRPVRVIGTLNPEYYGSVVVSTQLVLGCARLGVQTESADDA